MRCPTDRAKKCPPIVSLREGNILLRRNPLYASRWSSIEERMMSNNNPSRKARNSSNFLLDLQKMESRNSTKNEPSRGGEKYRMKRSAKETKEPQRFRPL